MHAAISCPSSHCFHALGIPSGAQVEDHDSSAVWLGKQLQCHLEPLQKFQQHVASEIRAGKDEAALLWPFA